MRKSLVLLAVVMSACLAVAGCGSKKPKMDPNAGTNTSLDSGADANGVRPATASDEGAEAPGPMEGLLAKRTIYFDFDSSEIRSEYIDVIAAHGRFLAGNANLRVRLEGHTDERGSREYNIGLGEQRAQTVKRALALQGVQDAQIATVSYGEERPAAAGSDENAYSKNRRVEIVYIN